MTSRFTPLTCLAALAVLAGCSVPVVTNGNVGGTYGTPGQPATQQPGGTASPQPAGPAKAVKDVRVTPDSFVVTVNDAKDLLATVAYTDGTFDGNVAWSSSDSRIVDVNPTTGKLQAKAEGIATVVAVVMGAAVLHLRGTYFAVLTFGMTELIRHAVTYFEKSVTGTVGRVLTVVPDRDTIYLTVLALAVLAVLVSIIVRRSRFGLALMGIGADEQRAQTLGVNTRLIKVAGFAMTAAFA
ncbi:MAG: ABC transporter permease subunit, partial [Candidatus Sericytochromatia bacterium]